MPKRVIFHIDVNSAYLSWEAAYRLQHGAKIDLRNVPSAVGGDAATRHGIILAKSIPAKKFKIKTGEPLFSARQKCPTMIIVPPNYELYMECSNALLKLLKEYSPKIQRFSVDECFMDMTNMDKLWGPPWKVAYEIKERIKDELGFTVSIGISTCKLLAKIASELKKPDGVTTLFSEEIEEKMWSLPVEDLFMVGPATTKKLHSYGIHTIGALAKADPRFLQNRLQSHGLLIWNYANGRENSPVRENVAFEIKGIGNSTTIAFDVDNLKEAKMVLLSLVETIGSRLRRGGWAAKLIAVTFKTSDFGVVSHQRKFSTPVDCTNIIYQRARELFSECWNGEHLRHLGVKVGELCTNDFTQLSLFDWNQEKLRKLDKAVDKIRKKYGAKALTRSSFLHSGIDPLSGGVIEDYPLMSSIL